jgi:hypothetical protein
MNDRDLEMLDAWRHGRLSEQEFALLEERLREDAELRGGLRMLAEVEEVLTAHGLAAVAGPEAPAEVQPTSGASRQRSARLPWAVAAAACLAAAVAWWSPWLRGRVDRDHGPPPERTGRVMAMLVDEAAAVFAPPRPVGEPRFDPGGYELLAGTVHLRFVNGADLVIEGPARFEIQTALRTVLSAGRVRAIVPPTAQGFTVVTGDAAYEDVGTEFGLSVDAVTGESRMHVFDGTVNLRNRDAAGAVVRSVDEGGSVRFLDGRLQESPPVNVGDFPSPNGIGHARWSAQREKRLADPSLIAWFPFERGADANTLTNAVPGRGVSDGRISAARWATGRWPGKQALLFDSDGDFVELDIPEQHAELTVAAWLKVDRFDHEMSAILNSDGEHAGGLHLQMNRLGLLRGGLLGMARPNLKWVGNPVPTGKWVHVVSVTSVPNRRHVIYVNGRPVLESGLAGEVVPVQPRRCRLAGWSRGTSDAGNPTRSLSGLVDELSIWNRSLSAAEVVALTESGRPSLIWSPANPPLKVPLPKY